MRKASEERWKQRGDTKFAFAKKITAKAQRHWKPEFLQIKYKIMENITAR